MICSLLVRYPELFQNLVGLEEELAIETVEVG